MRNKFAQNCYVCGKTVEVGQGFFQRDRGKWVAKHEGCKGFNPKHKTVLSKEDTTQK